jgi:hypothetical protein
MNPINGVKALLHRVGFAVRESGQALERVGCRLQGIYSFEEKCKDTKLHTGHPELFLEPHITCLSRSEPARARASNALQCPKHC